MMAAAAANKIPPPAVVEPLRTAQARRAQHPPAPPVNRATQRWGPDRASTQNLHSTSWSERSKPPGPSSPATSRRCDRRATAYVKLEQAKQACERHYRAGCDLSKA